MAALHTHGGGEMPSPPADLSYHFSKVTKNRKPSAMKAFYKFMAIPGIGNLAGGLPNVQYFPFDTLEAQIAKPERWIPTPNDPEHEALSQKLAKTKVSDVKAASHISVPKIAATADPSKKIDLATALQYGTAQGYPPLHSFVRQFTRDHLHPNVPYANGPEVVLTVGSTDGFSKTMELLVDPWHADTDPIEDRPGILCEVFAYNSALAQAAPRGVEPVGVEIDDEGMMASGPGGLQDILEHWNPKNGRRPQLMYSVTMGHNPTGCLLSLQRRKEIYALCQKYDIIIIEDEPYWYLQFPSATLEEAKSRGLAQARKMEKHVPVKSSGYEFLDSLVPSYLSIDTDGRVVRLDTFSKTVAPGCRVGWITAQPAFIERYERITETSTQQPSGFVQSMLSEVMIGSQPAAMETFRSLSPRDRATFTGWKMDGWIRWVEGLRGAYERRMGIMCSILDEHSYQLKQSTPVRDTDSDWGVITKTKLMSFDWPRAGMFVWVRIHYEDHPLFQAKGTKYALLDGPVLAQAMLVFFTTKPYMSLPAPGSIFGATEEITGTRAYSYMRLCFAAESDENVELCSKKLGLAVQKFWRIKDVKEIENLLDESPGAQPNAEELTNIGYFTMGC